MIHFYIIWSNLSSATPAVSGYFDYVEGLIERENTFAMEEFPVSVNEFLAF